jgi:glycerophosphoryl diester phosphodiesterase
MKKISVTYILMVCFFAVSCSKEEYSIRNLNGNRIMMLGHGGMGTQSTYPMNSMESILACLNLGLDGTEFDVQMTKDCVLVAFHDMDLSDGTNLNGLVHSLKWEDLSEAFYTEFPYLNYPLITLDELFMRIDSPRDYFFSLHCKLYYEGDTDPFFDAHIEALIAMLQKYQLENNVCIESQSESFLARIQSKQPDLKLLLYPSTFDSGLKSALSMNLHGISISNEDISAEQLKHAHDSGLFVAIWDVNTRSQHKEAISKNPDYIQTDNARVLLELLNER